MRCRYIRTSLYFPLMPVSFRTLLPYAFGLLLAGGIVAAKSPADNKQYDYATIVQHGNTLSITSGADKFEEVEVSQAGKKNYLNFSPLLKKVSELESQGYELVENDYSGSAQLTNYVLLRKPK